MKQKTPTRTNGSKTKDNGRMALNMLTLIIAGAMLLFSACKRDEIKPVAAVGPVKTTMSMEDGKKLEARIQSFYAQMKALKGTKAHAKGVEETMPLDSVEFLTEATYNYYVARNSDEQTKTCDFEIREPMMNESLEMSDVSEAFYRVKDSLMKVYNDIAYTDKRLSAFDLEVTNEGGEAKFAVKASITEGPAPTGNYTLAQNQKKYFSGPSNQVWLAFLAYSSTGTPIPGVTPTYLASYPNGVGLADFNTGQLISQNNTQPGAWGSLRSLAVYNIIGLNPALQLYTNIHAVGINTNWQANVPFVVAQGNVVLPAPYSTFPNFDNTETYSTMIYANPPGIGGYNDPNATLKQWLSVDLMNQYLTHAPAMVAAAVPAGKAAFDFNVIATNAINIVPGPGSNQWHVNRSVGYVVSYGTPTSIVLTGGYTIGLSTI